MRMWSILIDIIWWARQDSNLGPIHYECTALTTWATGPNNMISYNILLKLSIIDNKKMVGRVGYAPTTPAMSMQYSTIELTAPKISFLKNFLIVLIYLDALVFLAL